jgi:hypothetical protein
MGNDPLRNGLSIGNVTALAIVTLAFLAVSAIVFNRRDVGV